MATTKSEAAVVFKVLDAMDGPHDGRILRLRLQSGDAPSPRQIKGARFRAVSPDGEAERTVRVKGFAAFGGKPSEERLARTGRIDVHVEEEGPDDRPVTLQWKVSGPI